MRSIALIIVAMMFTVTAVAQETHLGAVQAYERKVVVDLDSCAASYTVYLCRVALTSPENELPIAIADVTHKFDFGTSHRVFITANHDFYELQILALESGEYRISWPVAQRYFRQAIDRLGADGLKLTTFKAQ